MVCCVVLCCVVVCCVAMRCVALRYEGNTVLRYGVMCCVALRCAAAPLANLHPAQPRFNFGGQFSLQIRGASFELSDASHRCACMHACTYVLINVNTQTTYSRMMEIIKMKKYYFKKGTFACHTQHTAPMFDTHHD